MTKKILQTRDLQVRTSAGSKRLTIITTSDLDEKGKLKPKAKERIEGTDEGAAKAITTRDIKKGK